MLGFGSRAGLNLWRRREKRKAKKRKDFLVQFFHSTESPPITPRNGWHFQVKVRTARVASTGGVDNDMFGVHSFY